MGIVLPRAGGGRKTAVLAVPSMLPTASRHCLASPSFENHCDHRDAPHLVVLRQVGVRSSSSRLILSPLGSVPRESRNAWVLVQSARPLIAPLVGQTTCARLFCSTLAGMFGNVFLRHTQQPCYQCCSSGAYSGSRSRSWDGGGELLGPRPALLVEVACCSPPRPGRSRIPRRTMAGTLSGSATTMPSAAVLHLQRNRLRGERTSRSSLLARAALSAVGLGQRDPAEPWWGRRRRPLRKIPALRLGCWARLAPAVRAGQRPRPPSPPRNSRWSPCALAKLVLTTRPSGFSAAHQGDRRLRDVLAEGGEDVVSGCRWRNCTEPELEGPRCRSPR